MIAEDIESGSLLGGLLDTLATHLVLWVLVLLVFAALMMGTGYKFGQWREQDKQERREEMARRMDARRKERRAQQQNVRSRNNAPPSDYRPAHRDVTEDHTAAIDREVFVGDPDTRELMARRLRNRDAAGLDHWSTQGYRGADDY